MRPIDADGLNKTLEAIAMWYTFEENGKCRGADDFTRGIKIGVTIALEKVAEQPTINPYNRILENLYNIRKRHMTMPEMPNDYELACRDIIVSIIRMKEGVQE